ncbi:MAG: hypothetical protein JSR66_24315 [Proteobacteria bacterium]|nr:hypothetical protein [Pseudomonadota bacterium]
MIRLRVTSMLQEIEAVANVDVLVGIGPGLRALFALCGTGHGMVSVDTGPAHVAGALGLALAVLYGAESPDYWLPRTPCGSPVLGVGGPPDFSRAEQVPVDALFNAWLAVTEVRETKRGHPAALPRSAAV